VTSRSSLGDVLVLTLDTSTPAVTVAVSRVVAPDRAAETLASATEVATNRHGELLTPMIEASLRDAGRTPADLAAVGVGLGPGPFTGLRVGIMTAAAIGDGLGVPVYGASSLDVIAAGCARDGRRFAVLTDARRKQVYWAAYDEVGQRIEGPDVATPIEVAARLAGRVTHVTGAGALAHRDRFSGFAVDETHVFPDAAVLAGCVAGKVLDHAAGDQLTPLYLRRPDATPPGRPKRVTPV
jgi:tRNA threonylcarbamoyl adenosine modification protein YeaZ